MKDKVGLVARLLREREGKRCKRCHRIIRGLPVWDTRNGRRDGPFHQRCAPSFRDKIEVK